MPGAAYFDGGDFSYVNTDGIAVDTTHAFTAGVWVLPGETGRDMTAITQSGISGTANSSLGTTTDAAGNPVWSFELPSADGESRAVTGGTLQAGEWAYLAGVYDPATGTARLYVDGDGDYLESDIPPLDTGKSWAVSAKVRLHGTPGRDMAVLAQNGWQADAFTLRYRAADRTWQAVLAHADEPDAATTEISGPATGGTQTLLLQYDAKAGQVQLWIDGTLASSAPYAEADAWETVRFLQAGRDSAADGAGAHYLYGDIDDVRTWAGALSEGEINSL
ncbi:LamG-like jellyroll fold domain-containing protein [Streptomyces sp. ITFR-6]|uniref:LamG-like jellyroll fold domain-containing protein n=1 Tax=Streptomyces sp. ITFR-6 TaxID=3075197 RepID=UPI0028898BE4|nr:LamG-like jellyroll fold domain-containing protein [Streptomyces sp. ITFR-6]WNI28778.1 LamG-like jellyroll fold domain-containing protein [Streptomyces sp. ITFR-6]